MTTLAAADVPAAGEFIRLTRAEYASRDAPQCGTRAGGLTTANAGCPARKSSEKLH